MQNLVDVSKNPTVIERLQAGSCLCLNCGVSQPNWPKKFGGVEYPTCDECGGMALSWENVQELSQCVSTDEWRQLQAEYPEVIAAAEAYAA